MQIFKCNGKRETERTNEFMKMARGAWLGLSPGPVVDTWPWFLVNMIWDWFLNSTQRDHRSPLSLWLVAITVNTSVRYSSVMAFTTESGHLDCWSPRAINVHDQLDRGWHYTHKWLTGFRDLSRNKQLHHWYIGETSAANDRQAYRPKLIVSGDHFLDEFLSPISVSHQTGQWLAHGAGHRRRQQHRVCTQQTTAAATKRQRNQTATTEDHQMESILHLFLKTAQWLLHLLGSVMLSPRGQSGLEAKILASASASELWPRPRSFGLGLGLEVLASAWPRTRYLIM